ncbi:hypothetical protein OF387_05905 [Lentilactobacillus hilgardii]|nr:hypothetical protein [Lentilactobacillus hilgardii]MCV3740755.1 hypothetical protein [Lentilactobacillus hilgardii]
MLRTATFFRLIIITVTAIVLSPFLAEGIQAKAISNDVDSVEKLEDASNKVAGTNQQMIDQANNNTVFDYSPYNDVSTNSLDSTSQGYTVQSTNANYKEGVTKVVSHSATTGTMYVSRSTADAIIQGGAVTIGFLSAGVVAWLLSLAGITAVYLIKGGFKINYEYVQGTDGQYHVAYTGFSWQ